MRYVLRFDRRLVATIVAAAAAWPLAQVAHAGPLEPIVPRAIEVDDGNKVFLVGHAVGVQIYSCNATASGFAGGSSHRGRTSTTTTETTSPRTSADRRGRPRTAATWWPNVWTA